MTKWHITRTDSDAGSHLIADISGTEDDAME